MISSQWSIEHFGEPGASEGQEPERGHVPRVLLAVAVEHGAETFKFLRALMARDGAPRIHDDVGAGVGNVLGKLAPVPGRPEHGA
ncbi:MAG: hypothetical protein GKR94_12065 [Gammaproteobacteria bacterium]|nr:hypothetical protein [Gammaproteobacteria bacterium]